MLRLGEAGARPSPQSSVPLLSCVVDVDSDDRSPTRRTSGVPVMTSSSENDITARAGKHEPAADVDAAAAANCEFLY